MLRAGARHVSKQIQLIHGRSLEAIAASAAGEAREFLTSHVSG